MLYPMRTLLYVPGNKRNMLVKAVTSGADILVPDLEDAVPPAEKDAARAIVAEEIRDGALNGARVIVRVNGFDTAECSRDLEAVVMPGILGLRIPKVESPAEVRELDAQVTELERSRGLEVGGIALIPILESPLGIVRAYEIMTASPRVRAVSMGGEDLTVGLGTERSADGLELRHARGQVVLCAGAAGIPAIDTVYSNVQDEEGLIVETKYVKQLGFAGKSVIHPRQIAPVHAVYTHASEEVEKARRIVEAFERAKAEGSGAVAVDGRMVDLPVVLRARRILSQGQS